MRKMLAVLILISSTQIWSKSFTCETGQQNGCGADHMYVVVDKMLMKCHDELGMPYTANITGLGLGLEGTGGNAFVYIDCGSSETITNPDFYGIKAGAGFLVGVDVAAFANTTDGICIMSGGAGLNLGAQVSASRLSLTRGTVKNFCN